MSFNIDGIGLDGDPTPPKTIEGETSRIIQRMLQTGLTYADKIPEKIYMYFQLKDNRAVLDLIFSINGKLYDMVNLNEAGVMDEVSIDYKEDEETLDSENIQTDSDDTGHSHEIESDSISQSSETKLIPHVFDISEEKQTQLMGFMSQGISEFTEAYKTFNRMTPDEVWGSINLDDEELKVKATIGYLPVGSTFPLVSDVTAAWKSDLEALDEKFFDMITAVPTNDEIFYSMFKEKEPKVVNKPTDKSGLIDITAAAIENEKTK